MYKGPQRKFERKTRSRARLSAFGIQLLEKQKVRNLYGIREKMLKKYFAQASQKGGDFTSSLVSLLERRLDNVVFRLGFAITRSQARQIVNHGHILVNGRRINIPSHLVKAGDDISIRKQSTKKGVFTNLLTSLKKYKCPAWMKLTPASFSGKILQLPTSNDIAEPYNISLIIEYYSR